MTGRYLLLIGARRAGWAPLLVRLAARSGLRLAFNRFPLAVLQAGPCDCLPAVDGAVIGTLFHRHGPPRPIDALQPREAEAVAATAGTALLRSYWGGYVSVARDGEGFRLMRDPSGALPCYFLRTAGLWAFASGADLLADCGLARVAIDWPALARHLFAAGLPRPETVLDGVRELLPGFALRLPGDGAQDAAWNPWDHVRPSPGLADGTAADQLVRATRQAVLGWAWGARGIVLAISGGLDSSIVAAALDGASAEILAATLFTEDPAGDERPYARLVCDALGLRLAELPYRVEQVDIARAFAPQLPRPVGRIQAQAYDASLTELAESAGADRFMTGNGGDNVFAYSQSAAAIADRWLAEGLGPGLMATIADTCRQTGAGIGPAIRAAVRIGRRPPGYACRPDPRLLSREVLAELSAMPLHHPWLEAPAGALPGKAGHIAGLLRAQHTLEPGRSRFAPVRHPLLSQPVVELCLSIPSWAWRAGGIDRAFARGAFRQCLPPAILARRVKGTPDAFSSAVLQAYRRDIRDRLLGGHLAGHRLIDGGAVTRLLDQDPGRAAEANLRLLQLVAVEAWLDHWLARGTSD